MNTTSHPVPTAQSQNQLVRQRATRRLNQITAGAAIAGVTAVVGFAAAASAIHGGSTGEATATPATRVAATVGTTTGSTSTTGTTTTTATTGTSTTTTTSTGLGGTTVAAGVSGTGQATTGGS